MERRRRKKEDARGRWEKRIGVKIKEKERKG